MMEFLLNFTKNLGHYSASLSFNVQMNASRKVRCHTQKQALITLIEKKGKDRSLIENWRPISLVNVDAKIMFKVIATRTKNVLPSIIHHNQTGFIKAPLLVKQYDLFSI